MSTRLIIDGNAVYEVDEECEACCRRQEAGRTKSQSDDKEMTGAQVRRRDR
ncbi:MAG: hypothetical protein Q4C73_03715 [Eubacteriales bacterium]|nr:hypothetical protein [Eubacteriales bacterium]